MNMKFIGLILAIAFTLTGCKTGLPKETTMKIVYRINCGSTASYTDKDETLWAADQGFSESKTVAREKTLPIDNTAAPEVYRSERYGMKNYTLPVAPGTYTVRLHFAETFDCNYRAGKRSFDVSVNGKTVIEAFDPYTAAGGVGRPVIIEYAGCSAVDQIEIEFSKGGAIYGIEVFEADTNTQEAIQQITPTAKPEETFIGKRLEATPNARTLKVLFIGNSGTFYWAIPESLQAMLNIGTHDLRIEPHRSLHGGKTLNYHYNETDALDLIKNGDFDLVFLQPGSKEQLDPQLETDEYVKKFDRAIRASGAKPILYAYPGHLKTTDRERRGIMDRFVQLAKELNIPLIPACETLRLCYTERAEIIWHNADTVHMGMHGGYAVACTFYAALAGSADFPPPAVLAQQVGIEPELAEFIQEKARQALKTYPLPDASFLPSFPMLGTP